ncbi:MAG: Mov34/MPN/PAD-1 family protein [archaeon]
MEDFDSKFIDAIANFFKRKISKIILSRQAAFDLIDFAQSNYPNEFIAALGGKIKEESLIIDRIYYQPFFSGKASATTSFKIPIGTGEIGTVHSHPSGTNRPSGQDLSLFSKKGVVHIIISYPYEERNISLYDFHGNELNFEID